MLRFLRHAVSVGQRVLVGVDFPFGYPAGVAEHLCGARNALALWQWLDELVADAPDNQNNRYDVASRINRSYPGIGPCWGRPAAWDVPDVPTTAKARRGGNHPPEQRIADRRTKGAKTVWQLAYAGSVGSQVLLGIPVLQTLRTDPHLKAVTKIWPFETGLQITDSQIVIAEMYPSLLDPDPSEPVKDAGQVKAVSKALRTADRLGNLAELFHGPADLTPDERETIVREEAWILGSGQPELLCA